MPETFKKKRIFQVAKELNISHMEILTYLEHEGVPVDSHMAPVDSNLYEKILAEFSKEKLQVERLRKEKARKLVVSKMQKIKHVTPEIKEPEKAIRKIKTSLKEENLALSDKLKLASNQLKNEKAKEAEKLKKQSESNSAAAEMTNEVDPNSPEAPSKKLTSRGVELKVIKKADPPKEKATPKKNELKKLANVKRDTEKRKIPPPDKPRKFKKITIADIADKINQTKKSQGRGRPGGGKAPVKQPLPQFGKKPTKKKVKKKGTSDQVIEEVRKKTIKVPEFTTVDELARSLEVKVQEVIMACMGLGMMATINQRMDMDSIVMIADEFGFDVETVEDYSEEIVTMEETDEDVKKATPRPPVVTIMGHVDHGKTSLLDYIRSTNVVAGEAGGITQHIGAYEVLLDNDKKITFLDTPGHAAFTAMRARGAQVTDIVIVIVAADDDVMPQTIEAIDHAKAASVPIVIAINKIDRANADSEKIKKALAGQNILVEDWGGKYQCGEISAKSGKGIPELLEKVLMESELLELKANKETHARGSVIESRLDKGLGAIATVLIQKGTLKKGEIFVCGTQCAKVRELLNERNQKVDVAYPSDPVQILGFSEVPNAGESFTVFKDEREGKKIALERSQLKREAEQRRFRKITLDQIGKKISSGEVQELDIIIKGDVDGSIEALSDTLMELSNDEVAVKIIHRSVGMITENDVSLASASKAIIIAFNVNSSSEAKTMAKSLGVEIRNYTVIYEAIQEVKLALEGLLEPEEVEEAIGIADVRAKFKIPKLGIIAGCYITEGKVVRNALLRVKREGEVLHEGKLTSLKRFKDDASEVMEGYECGIGVDGFNKFIEGDKIEVYEIKEIKRSLA